MTNQSIQASVSGKFIETKTLAGETQIVLDASACVLPISATPNILSDLQNLEKDSNLHLAGRRTDDRFVASAVLPQDRTTKIVGEVTRVLRNGAVRMTLTDGRRCTISPSTVKARQTSASLRPKMKVCAVGFEIEPPTQSEGRSKRDRTFLDAFYVKPVR
ncbi:MAG: hypothetical protein OXC95_13775 [Dehalococcoidia bacterium]|nr:hypothetical protein [Dehalococcoidia bacterium]